MTDFQFFLPIAKLDKEARTISGYASTPAKDSDGEIITLDAIKQALPDYMRWGNIREMHKLSAVGTAQEANMDAKGLFLTAKIVDPAAWEKCVEGVYKGFSIGGRKLDKTGNKITEIEMTEISVVDRPANSECSFALAKRAKDVGEVHAGGFLLKTTKPKISTESKALAKLAKVIEGLAKAGPPAAHDGLSLPAKTTGPENATNASKPTQKAENGAEVTDEGPQTCDKHGKIGCKKCAIVKRMSTKCEAHGEVGCSKCAFGKASGDSAKPYGDVEYADPGLRSDGKHRYPIDNEEHVRAAWNYINKPKNAAKYGDKAAGVKAKIIAAWKKHVDKAGPPSAENAGKTEKAISVPELTTVAQSARQSEIPAFLTLGKAKKTESLAKSMNTVGSLAYVFDSIRNAQRSLLLEGKREGGDSKDKDLANRLGSIAEDLSSIISTKASHEGAEARTLTDADDLYLNNVLGEEFMMANDTARPLVNMGADPLSAAILDMVKRAAEPTRAMRMAKAEDDVKMARKAMKMAKAAIEDCHKLHKAAFLAKAAKGKDKGEKDGDEFDHTDAMEKLQKAYGEIEKARTFGKGAIAQLQKAAARSGQRGQETSDGNEFYEVPAGVKDLTPMAMAGAAPGTKTGGSQPPMYPDDGSVYAGKGAGGDALQKFAKNGMVPVDVMELIMAKASAEGELAALRRLPASGMGGRRPSAFNPAVFGNTTQSTDLNKALFDGVNVNAIGSGDERAHTEASAHAIGNFLTSGHFGKSIMDPSFKGAAGSAR